MPPILPHGYQRDTSDWTRIEMLLALYEAAITSLETVRLALEQGNQQLAVHERLRASSLVEAIESGLNPTYGELAARIGKLCQHIKYCLLDGSGDKIDSAITVLKRLCEGFQAVREEAMELEHTGVIPRLAEVNALDTIA